MGTNDSWKAALRWWRGNWILKSPIAANVAAERHGADDADAEHSNLIWAVKNRLREVRGLKLPKADKALESVGCEIRIPML